MTDDFATRKVSRIKMRIYGTMLRYFLNILLYHGRFISAIFVISWTFPRTALVRCWILHPRKYRKQHIKAPLELIIYPFTFLLSLSSRVLYVTFKRPFRYH